MDTALLGTIVTYTISDDDARAELVEILDSLGYVPDEDQSTMTNTLIMPLKTMEEINNYCANYVHGFDDGDTISTYAGVLVKGKNAASTYRIKRRTYRYDSDDDAFI